MLVVVVIAGAVSGLGPSVGGGVGPVAGQPTLTFQQYAHMINNSPAVFTNDSDNTDEEVMSYPDVAINVFAGDYDDGSDACVASSGIRSALPGLVTVTWEYGFPLMDNPWRLTVLLTDSPEAARALGAALSSYNVCDMTRSAESAGLKPFDDSGNSNGVNLWSQGFDSPECWSTIPGNPDGPYWMAGCDYTIAYAQYGNVLVMVAGGTDTIWDTWRGAGPAIKAPIDQAAG